MVSRLALDRPLASDIAGKDGGRNLFRACNIDDSFATWVGWRGDQEGGLPSFFVWALAVVGMT